jgi:hypothetical protein
MTGLFDDTSLPEGIMAVPGGSVSVTTRRPVLIEAWVERQEARCCDEIQLNALLSATGFDGIVAFRIRCRGLAHEETLRVPAGGRAIVSTTWHADKHDTHWNDDPDVEVTVALHDREGDAVLSEVEMHPKVRITRPDRVHLQRCIPRGHRTHVPMWVRRGGVWRKSRDQYYEWPCNFDLELEDGVVTVTGRVKLIPRHHLVITDTMKRDWKRGIERIWDYKPYILRRQCDRGGLLDQLNPCTYSIRIRCEFVDTHEYVRVNVHPGAATGGWGSSSWPNSTNWWVDGLGDPDMDPMETHAHEFGHAIGLYDDYKAGGIDPSVNPNGWTEPQTIMYDDNRPPGMHHYRLLLRALELATHEQFVVVDRHDREIE